MNHLQVLALKVKAHRPPSRPLDTAVGDQHWALMVRCWSYPQRRPTAREVVVVVQTFFSVDTHDIGHGRGTSQIWVFFFFDLRWAKTRTIGQCCVGIV